MQHYPLRNIPDGLWQRFKARAAGEGMTARALILLLIEAYVEGRVNVRKQMERGR